jgi:hypothetical protein
MDDRILRELGKLARQEDEADQARFDERWDRLAAGTLTAEEQTELEALAASSPEGKEAYEAFRPLGAEFQARMVAMASAELASSPAVEPPVPPAPPLPFRRVARRVEVWLGAAAAVAASLFFLLRPPTLPSLPVYEADEPGVQSAYRGVGSATATPGSQVTLKVRPRTAVMGDLEVRSFLSYAGGDLHPWHPQPSLKINKTGVVDLHGRLEKGLRPGECEIWTVVARPGKIPKDLQAELHAGRTGTADWQAVSTKLEIRLPP